MAAQLRRASALVPAAALRAQRVGRPLSLPAFLAFATRSLSCGGLEHTSIGSSVTRSLRRPCVPVVGTPARCLSTAAPAQRMPDASDEPLLIVTRKASERIRQLAEKAGNDGTTMLRVTVYEGGCHGMEYKFKIERGAEAVEEDDTVVEFDGAKIVMDSVTVEKMRGSTLDYLTDLQGELFAVTFNPLAAASCGCGSSFSPK